MDNSRRNLLKIIASLTITFPLPHAFSKVITADNAINMSNETVSNFKYIYNQYDYKKQFYPFLVNVFHLFPEKELHQLISDACEIHHSDQEIYINTQNKLNDISSIIAPLTYAIPALNKQKNIIASQTVELLHDKKLFNGYLEIGTTGRYLDELEERLSIDNDRYFITERKATYSPTDMVDRGQMYKAGTDILLNNYQPDLSSIEKESIELVTVYIGFHHCPVHLREEFISNINNLMRPGGYLVVRDHNVNSKKMNHTVALAHDVFNMGTKETWEYNSDELRHFYSLNELDLLLVKFGFVSDGVRIYQEGDPTQNALMLYRKI